MEFDSKLNRKIRTKNSIEVIPVIVGGILGGLIGSVVTNLFLIYVITKIH